MTSTPTTPPAPAPAPSRDDNETTTCPVCRRRFTPTGRQTYCTSACRKTAHRRRHQHPTATLLIPTTRPRREHTVYQCPDCDQRLIGEQRCPDCGVFARRAGLGGPCPHCDEPVTINDLLDPHKIEITTHPSKYYTQPQPHEVAGANN
jgi:hypothetical protein